jgi:hypothetical protein
MGRFRRLYAHFGIPYVVLDALRDDFADYWRAVMLLVPHWPGFRPERYSAELLPIARECARRRVACRREREVSDLLINQHRAKYG